MATSRAGLFDSLRRLLRTGLEITQVRLELLGADLALEKLRLIDVALRALLGAMLIVIGLVLLIGFAIPSLIAWVRAAGLQLVVQPLYQNFGYNAYDPNWWRSSPLFPKSDHDLDEIDAALDALCAERLRGGPVCNAVAQLSAMKRHFRAPAEDNGASCRAGHSDLSFDPQGNVRLCYFLEPVGTLFDTAPLPVMWDSVTALRRRWEVSRCERACSLLNCNFERRDGG